MRLAGLLLVVIVAERRASHPICEFIQRMGKFLGRAMSRCNSGRSDS